MTPSVRILTLIYADPLADRLAPDHPWQQFDALGQTLRRHLPAATAAVFARPEIAADGSVTWTSELAGQPRPLSDLPEEEQAAARRILDDHLNAIARLADDLTRREPDDPEPARLLARAVVYPGDEAAYVIDGAPVLISWGGTDPGRPPRAAGAPDPTTVPTPPRRPAWIVRVLGLIALATLGLGLALGVWLWQLQETEEGLRKDLVVALANQCDPVAPLVELASRLERIDGEDARYADVRMAVLTEIGICEEVALFTERFATEPPCDHLLVLDAELAFYDLEREPFRALKADLDRRISDCARIAGLAQRLDAVAGDCLAVAELQQEIAKLDAPASEPMRELAALRLGLDHALAACRLAETLGLQLADASEDCTALRALARETAPAFAELDASRPPLSEIREGLDEALAHCDLADHLEGELARSQDDCLALAGLHETLARHDPDREPLAALAGRLAIALRQCADLNDLEQRFAEANGDCDRLQALADALGTYRNNLRFLDIRTRLAPELQVCSEADALEDQIAAIGGDCTRARELAARLADQGDSRFAKARDALKAPIADCERVDGYTQRLAKAGTDCTRLVALERDLKRESSPMLRPTRRELGERIGPCRPPPPKPVVAQAPPKAAPPEIRPATEPTAPPPIPKESGSFAMRGDCTGRLTIDPTSGWDGDRVRHVVAIDPPASERVARVTSTNPGCRNCALRKIGRNTWRGDLFYGCRGRGIVQVSYAAYDASGRMICSGNGSDLCLGRRRR